MRYVTVAGAHSPSKKTKTDARTSSKLERSMSLVEVEKELKRQARNEKRRKRREEKRKMQEKLLKEGWHASKPIS